MRILSLNVAQLAGRTGFLPLSQGRAPRVARELARIFARRAPDVLALQEAPPPRAGRDPIAELLGPDASIARFEGPRHGPAILTRCEMNEQSAQLFANGIADGKGVVTAQVLTPNGPLVIASVHLAVLHRRLRRRQIDRVAEILSQSRCPTVVVGDLNDGADAPRYLSRTLGLVPHSPGRTFPSIAPALRLDWAFVSPELRVQRLDVLSDLPSDHCAICLEVDLAAAFDAHCIATRNGW